MYYAKQITEQLKNSKEIVIFGAGNIAEEVAYCLLGKPYELKIAGFMVSEKGKNPDQIFGLPVMDLAEGKKKYRNACILLAVMEKYQDEILAALAQNGFCSVIPVTFESDLWSELRGNYYQEYRLSQGKTYLTLEEGLKAETAAEEKSGAVEVYMAKCHVDRPLSEEETGEAWEIPIQVGAALSDQRIAEVCDNTGEHISDKNKEYCELTALYWIWKNAGAKYEGLCHYRRHFLLGEKDRRKLLHSDIDVILTIPVLNFPDVRTAYCRDHDERDWEIMLQAIRVLAPEYTLAADKLQSGQFYYGYNMLIARKEILDDYCAWLFPILAYCEKKCGRKEDTYQNRYIGFLAERLMSIYFLHNENKYKIVHAKKHFIQTKPMQQTKKAQGEEHIVVYGAQMVAVSVYYALKRLYPKKKVEAFLVSDPAGNPKQIDGISVIPIEKFPHKDVTVLIAAPENHHAAIMAKLDEKGFEHYICIDAQKEAALMERYYEDAGEFQTLHAQKKGSVKAQAVVYLSKFIKDKELCNPWEMPDFVHPIQAGAALNEKRIAALTDDVGENISAKNVNYSELTALYWIGKHADAEYLGLFHYRRILDITPEDLYRLRENDVDVVLPFPTIQEPDCNAHHKRYVKDADWEAMEKALLECAPEYAKALPEIFADRYFYNYNMFLAKKEVWQDYCSWLFPILERTEELSVPKGSERADRYIGYLGENLTTLYFRYHRNDLRIVHTGRRMLT